MATHKNQDCYGFKWYKEGYTEIITEKDNKNKREYEIVKYLIGEIYTNNKGYEFEIIEKLPNNRRKIRFKSTGFETIAQIKEISNGSIKDWETPYVCGVGIVGKEIDKPQSHYLYDRWRDMLRRCYDEKVILKNHNKLNVCERWLRFTNYVKDIESLANHEKLKQKKNGWRIKLLNDANTYSLQTIFIANNK
jgi:hypothetical protein